MFAASALCMRRYVCVCECAEDTCVHLPRSTLSHSSPISFSQELEQQLSRVLTGLFRLSPSWGQPVSEALHLSEPSGCSGAFGKRSGVVRGGGEVEV